MGKGKRIKKERYEKQIEVMKKVMQTKETAQVRVLGFAKMLQEEVKAGKEISQHLRDRFEAELNDLLEKHGMEAMEEVMDVLITNPKLMQAAKEAEERFAKGERSLTAERHGYLMSPEGFSQEKLDGMLRRQVFYASNMGGVPRNHTETFEKKGWLLPYLFSTEYLFWGRYDYWHHILDGVRTIEESGPIPQITWCADLAIIRNVQSMLSDLINYGFRYGCTLDDFAEWLLFSFDATEKHPDIPVEVNERWYRTFDIGLLLRYPHDYMTWLLVEWNSKDVQEEREVSAEVPDFNKLTKQIAQEMEGKDPEMLKRMEFFEEEVGCGTSLLPYSNYTLFAEGGVADPLAAKLNKIQRIIYAPWFAHNPFRMPNHLRKVLSELRSLTPEGGTGLYIGEDGTGLFELEGEEEKEA